MKEARTRGGLPSRTKEGLITTRGFGIFVAASGYFYMAVDSSYHLQPGPC